MPPTIGGITMPYESGQSGTERPEPVLVTSPPAKTRTSVLSARPTAKRCRAVATSCDDPAPRSGVNGLSTEGKEAHQPLVLVLRELLDGAIAGLGQHALRDPLLQLGRDLRVAERAQQRRQSREDALEEVLDPARAAGEVELQAGPHDAPTESRPPAHGGVRVGDAQDVLLDEVQDLLEQRHLQPVRDVSGNLLLQQDGLLADGGVERHRALDVLGRRLLTAHDLD